MNRYDGLDKVIVTNVRVFANRLKNKRALRFLDIEDVEQELMCEALLCLQTFDEIKGNFEHYLRKVLSRRCVNLLQFYSYMRRSSFIELEEYDDKIFGRNCDISADISYLTNRFPKRYRRICELLKVYSVAETSEIIGCSRTTLYRDLKNITALANHSISPEILFFVSKGASMKNISVLEVLSAKEISMLDVCDLMDLNDQITNLRIQVKEMKQKMDDGLNLRFAETVKNNLKSEGKNTGTTRFFAESHQIIAEVPKKVSWDPEKMDEIIERISDERKQDLVKITYSVDEKKYLALPYGHQQLFKEARTVTPGKTKFQIQLGGDHTATTAKGE